MATLNKQNRNQGAVLIVDDDEFYRLELEMELTDIGYSIWLSTGNPSVVLEKLAQVEPVDYPDIALLDIRLKNSQSGTDLAQEVTQKGIPFIYLTGYPDESQFEKAKETQPAAYFLKPVSGLELHHAFQLAIQKIKSAKQRSVIEEDLELRDFLLIKNKENYLEKVQIAEIFVVESYGNLVLFHTPTQRYHLRVTLKEMEQILQPHNFIRIHRRYLISLHHLEVQLPLGEKLTIGGKVIPTGRQYRKILRKIIDGKQSF